MTSAGTARRHDCLIEDCPHRSIGYFELWLTSGTIAGAPGFCVLHATEAEDSSAFFATALSCITAEVRATHGSILRVDWISEGFFQ